MEELRAGPRRVPNGGARTGYDDVFGGPPRYAPPLDYGEIFGGLASACSIPFLGLPPPLLHGDLAAAAAGVDYDDIFGGFGDAAAYEAELAAEPERPEIILENGSRSLEETDCGQNVAEVAEFHPDEPSADHAACSDKDQLLSNSVHSDDGSKQFDVSLHKTSQENIEDGVNGTTYFTQVHTAPGITFFVENSSPLDNGKSDHPPSVLTDDLGLKADSNDGMTERNQETSPRTSSASSMQSMVAEQKDQKPFTTKDLPAEDAYVIVKQHSRSSSYHSTSSGDIYYSDAYVTLSDINLRTQPLQVPPPSRPPPKLVNKQETPVTKKHTNYKADLDDVGFHRPVMIHRMQSSHGFSRKPSLQDSAKDHPGFYDVEVDVTSAAAASAAAMKEAMEQAQARLKTAKELMERKKENVQNRKKNGRPDGIKYREKYEDKASQEVKVLTQEMVRKTSASIEEKVNFAVDKCQEAKAKVSADHEDRKLHSTDEARQQVQKKETKSSNVLYNLGKETGEWKKDEQFYELINNEKKSKAVKEVHEQEDIEKQQILINNEKKPNTVKEVHEQEDIERQQNLINNEKKPKTGKVVHDQEDVEKQQKATTNSNADKENEAIVTKKNRKLWEINDARECEVKDKILRAGNMDSTGKEMKKIPSPLPKIHVQNGNANKVDMNSNLLKQEENKKKLKLAQEKDVGKEEGKMFVHEEGSAHKNSGKDLENFNDVAKHESNHDSENEGRELEPPVSRGFIICEKELSASCGNFEPHKSEMKVKLANKSCIQDGDMEEVIVPNDSCVPEVTDKVKAVEVAIQSEAVEETKEAADCEVGDEKVGNSKGTAARLDQEESKSTNGIPEACQWEDNEKKLGMNLAGSTEELEAMEEALEQTENKKRVGTVKEASQQHHTDSKTKETVVEVENEGKEQDAIQISDLESSKKELTAAEGGLGHEVHEKNNVLQTSNKLDKNCNGLNGIEDLCWNIAKDNLDAPEQVCLLRKKGDIEVSSENGIDTHGTFISEKTIPDAQEIEEEREREQEKERARRLQEEKEREREREKDRLAVEKATRDAHERSLAEARERAERIAVERITAEARQRALAEVREKAEKASAEALEKAIAEKASREARLKAERAAVERATAEARQRAVEKALAEKVASETRERAERLNATSRDKMRKDYESSECYRDGIKEDSGTRMKISSDVPCAEHYQSVSSLSSSQRYSHKNVSVEKFEGTLTESALRCKARLERHQRTAERAAKALAEKNLRDILAQREQAERNRLAETLDAEIRRWSSGKEGNLRALLSTLQYILGPDSGWQPIPLTDVITAAGVKKAYRKATLCVHPDKLQQRGASIQQKYICEKVFDLLKEAWNRFNSEER